MIDQKKLFHIPNSPGVYIFKNRKGDILYIGKAKDLKNRVNQYFLANSLRKKDMLHIAEKIEFIITKSEHEALFLEENMITNHRPPYNSLIKGDQSYIYIKIPKEDFPEITFTRYINNDNAIYIGPKKYRKELTKTLQLLRQFLQYRGCKKNQFKDGILCSDFLFGMCKGRCVYAKIPEKNFSKFYMNAKKLGFSTTKNFLEAKEEYKKILEYIINFFHGDFGPLKEKLGSEIQKAIKEENFEWAECIKNTYLGLEKHIEQQTVIIPKDITGHISIIEKHGNFWIYVIMIINKGKIIDMITLKENVEENYIDEIITKICREYKESIIRKKDIEQTIIFHKNINKLTTKKEKDELIKIGKRSIDSYIINSSFQKENIMQSTLEKLQKKYDLQHFPYIIEGIDISHFSGDRMSGGLVQFQEGIPFKKQYRQYKIKSIKKQALYSNDYKALEEIIIRRFNLEKNTREITYPQLFLIDGGEKQLNVIQGLFKKYPEKMKEILSQTEFISIGKGNARKRKGKQQGEKEIIFTFKNNKIVYQELDYDNTDQILIKVRDEAHRFSNRYRENQMKKDFIK